MIKASILLVEDDPDVMRANRIALELEGYTVLEAGTLAKGREIVQRENPDLIVLDILLPDGNGLEYCRELRGENGVRILLLSALDTKADAIAGLRAGGDDYIAKPYLTDELLTRVETLLRRRLGGTDEPPLRIGALEIRFTSHRARLDGKDLILRPMEYALLEYLARRMDRYVTAEELYEKLWDMDGLGDTDTVTVHISKLRKKLGKDAPVVIESEWSKGYRLVRK